MRHHISIGAVIVTAIVWVSTPQAVFADSVELHSVITSGTAMLAGPPLIGGLSFDIAGDDFSLTGFVGEGSTSVYGPCPPGPREMTVGGTSLG